MGISSQKLKLKPINLNDKTIEEFCTEQVNLASKSIRTKGLRGDYDDYLQAFDDILSECDRLDIPVLIDMAYISISDLKELDLSHKSIRVITSSLSKVFPVEHHRIGIRMRKELEDDTLLAYNQNQYVNRYSVSLGYHMIKSFPNDWLFEKYKRKQKKICDEMGVEPSSCVIFGIDRNDRFSEYNRGGISNRLCFSKTWDGRI